MNLNAALKSLGVMVLMLALAVVSVTIITFLESVLGSWFYFVALAGLFGVLFWIYYRMFDEDEGK